MDKEILRLVIIVTGVLVIIGMVFWSVVKNRRSSKPLDWRGGKKSLKNIDPSLVLHPENDDFDVVPLGSPLAENDDITGIEPQWNSNSSGPSASESGSEPSVRAGKDKAKMPSLIQFSLVAVEDEGFNGRDLADAFKQVGLEYGSLKIFERVDRNRLVDFGVACMVEPGTFPETGQEDFHCPGIVFFMQPREVDDAVAVFDDFIRTIDRLAEILGGVKWDHQRQPLTEQTIQAIRDGLQG